MQIYTVTIQHTSHQFKALATETILQAALRQKSPLPWGCAGGICGVCMGTVVAGQVDYVHGQPLALFEEDQAKGKALFCCAYPRSDLVLAAPELGQNYQF